MPGPWTAALALSAALVATPALAAPTCPAGAFSGPDGDIMVITSTDKPEAREFTLASGRTGRLQPAGAPGAFVAGPGYDAPPQPVAARARLGGCDAPAELRVGADHAVTWTPIPLELKPVSFERDGVRFVGQLIQRRADARRATPVAVMVHGSSTDALVNTSEYGYMLAAQGVRVLLFNKRGTGGSGGTYTQDFSVLADDVVAAVAAARKAVGPLAGAVGLIGRSQGGWVGPLAASRTPVDFVVVAFGLVASPLEEDALQVEDEMIRAGYGAKDIQEAAIVSAATGRAMGSAFRDGLPELDQVRRTYGSRPWFHAIKGEYTGDILAESSESLAATGAQRLDNLQVPWHYDAVGVLRRVDAPQLWLLASRDRDAPSHTTIERLAELERQGRPIQTVIYPNTDHGMFEFREGADGARQRTVHPATYFRDIAAWMLAQPRRMQP